MLKKRGFTFLEIVIVLVIIGILAALAWPNFVAIKEKTLNREAKAILMLIRVAEKDYRMEYGFYYPRSATTGVISNINRDLKLSLPVSASVNWSISLNSAGSPEFATATRIGVGVDGRIWRINFSGDTEPTCSGGTACPL